MSVASWCSVYVCAAVHVCCCCCFCTGNFVMALKLNMSPLFETFFSLNISLIYMCLLFSGGKVVADSGVEGLGQSKTLNVSPLRPMLK